MGTAIRIACLVPLALASRVTWAAPKIDVSNDRVICRTVSGTASFSPGLTSTPADQRLSVKGIIDGCVDFDNPSVVVRTSAFSGKLAVTSIGCDGFFNPANFGATGTITIKWKTAKDTPLAQTSTTLTIVNVSATLFLVGDPLNANFAGLRVDYGDIAGAFTAGGIGNILHPFLTLIASQDTGAFALGCGDPSGAKKLNIGLGIFTAS